MLIQLLVSDDPFAESSFFVSFLGGAPIIQPQQVLFEAFHEEGKVKYFSVFPFFCWGVKMAEELTQKIEKTVKTTIKLADSLWREVKVYAARKGLKLTQVVEAALKEYLKESEEK